MTNAFGGGSTSGLEPVAMLQLTPECFPAGYGRPFARDEDETPAPAPKKVEPAPNAFGGGSESLLDDMVSELIPISRLRQAFLIPLSFLLLNEPTFLSPSPSMVNDLDDASPSWFLLRSLTSHVFRPDFFTSLILLRNDHPRSIFGSFDSLLERSEYHHANASPFTCLGF